MAECESLIAEVHAARSAHRRATTLAERDRVTALAESLGARLHDRLRTAGEQLRALQVDDSAFAELHGSSSAGAQIRSSLHARTVRHLASSLQRGEAALSDLRAELRARTERELRFVDPSLPEEQVSALADSGSAADFVRAHLQSESEAELRAAVAVIQQRQLGIRALQRQVTQLADLFRDLHGLAELQQESVDVIERRLAAARAAAAEGEEQIQQAHAWQTTANIVGSTHEHSSCGRSRSLRLMIRSEMSMCSWTEAHGSFWMRFGCGCCRCLCFALSSISVASASVC